MPFRIHWSWAPSLAILVWVLKAHFDRIGVANGAAAAIAVAVIAAGCVTLREAVRRLAGPPEGRRSGATLWPTGVVPRTRPEDSWGTELPRIAVGLSISLVLALSFAMVATTDSPMAVREAAEVLSRFNVAFAVFGLVPALPLDGGALLRARLVERGRSSRHATASLAFAGVLFGSLLAFAGAARVVAGDVHEGIGLAFAGAIVIAALRAERGSRPESSRPPAGVVSAMISRALVGVVLLVAAAALYHPPVALMSPGPTLDVLADIRISGIRTSPVNGRYFAASVKVSRPTALHVFVTLFRPSSHIVRRSQIQPLVEDPFREFGAEPSSFTASRTFAAVAAARAVGLEVGLEGSGARVLAAGPTALASGVVPGDVIVAVDDRPVRLLSDLRDAVTSRPAGTAFSIDLERGGRRLQIRMRSTVGERSAGTPGLDARFQTRDRKVDLPFEIAFGSPRATGSSAGLAYALAVADLLDARDIAGGRRLVATGLVHLSGQVDPIIGAIAKVDSARAAGGDLFALPAPDARDVASSGARLLGVSSVREALTRLVASLQASR
jgi:PDZ domain-containing protein